MYSFLQLAKDRYSVRRFSDKKIEKERLELILEAGRLAPTAHNNQPQRIMVLQDDGIETIRQCTGSHFGAPLALVVCYDKDAEWVHNEATHITSGAIDASIVCTHMMLQLAEMGLGSTWVQHYNHQELERLLGLPENFVSVAVLMVGYPAPLCRPSRLHDSRLPIEKTVFFSKEEMLAAAES